MKRIYIVLLIITILFNIYLFGFALPFMISDKHSDLVFIGILIAIADIWSTIEIGRYLIKKISNSEKQENNNG